MVFWRLRAWSAKVYRAFQVASDSDLRDFGVRLKARIYIYIYRERERERLNIILQQLV